MGPAREPRTTTDNPDLVFITYDRVIYPHHLTRAIHTSDFIYRGPALDTSLQTQTSSEMHLYNLAAGKGIAGTFSPVYLNASGITTEPDDIDVLADAVHRDCTCKSPPTHQVKFQDWVNRNLEGEHLDTAFWAPLARLLDHVRRQWMEGGDDGVDERSCYELTVRSVKFRVPKMEGAPRHFWHTEWWYPGPGQIQQPGPPSAANDYRHEPCSSGYAHSTPPTEGPKIYNTVELNDPLFQHLPATSSPTSHTLSNPSGDADAPAGRDLPGSTSSVASSPPSYRRGSLSIDIFGANYPLLSSRLSETNTSYSASPDPLDMPLQHDPPFTDGPRSEQFASDQLPSTPTPLARPTSPLSSTARPACISNRISVSPSSSIEVESSSSTEVSPSSSMEVEPSSSIKVEPSIDEAGIHGTPTIRIVAPLAGLGTLFINEPSPVAALVRSSNGGTGHAVRAPKQGELAIWRVGCDEKEKYPVFAAPSMTVGGERVFVSLVVGTEEQVRMRGNRSYSGKEAPVGD